MPTQKKASTLQHIDAYLPSTYNVEVMKSLKTLSENHLNIKTALAFDFVYKNTKAEYFHNITTPLPEPYSSCCSFLIQPNNMFRNDHHHRHVLTTHTYTTITYAAATNATTYRRTALYYKFEYKKKT